MGRVEEEDSKDTTQQTALVVQVVDACCFVQWVLGAAGQQLVGSTTGTSPVIGILEFSLFQHILTNQDTNLQDHEGE